MAEIKQTWAEFSAFLSGGTVSNATYIVDCSEATIDVIASAFIKNNVMGFRPMAEVVLSNIKDSPSVTSSGSMLPPSNYIRWLKSVEIKFSPLPSVTNIDNFLRYDRGNESFSISKVVIGAGCFVNVTSAKGAFGQTGIKVIDLDGLTSLTNAADIFYPNNRLTELTIRQEPITKTTSRMIGNTQNLKSVTLNSKKNPEAMKQNLINNSSTNGFGSFSNYIVIHPQLFTFVRIG